MEDRWEPPETNFIKVNVDAAFCQETRRGAWGFIARGSDGSFIAAGTGSMNHLSSALHAEASACVAAIESMSSLCALAFDVFDFKFCRRSCNKAANAIAQHGRDLGVQNLLWLDDEPAFVTGLLAILLCTRFSEIYFHVSKKKKSQPPLLLVACN
jgi:hypothetical protein